MIEGLDLHRTDFAYLFSDVTQAKQKLRNYAEPFARKVLGDQYVDNPQGWLGWDVTPVYTDGALTGLDFVAIVDDDRGPGSRIVTREVFA